MAWEIADGVFYLWERNYIVRQENRIIRASKTDREKGAARSLIGEQLDDTILRNIPGEDRTRLYDRLSQLLAGAESPEGVSPRDAATLVLGTFLRSAGAGLIIVAPFFVIGDVDLALTISNLAGLLLLFAVGYDRALERNVLSRVLFAFGTSLIGIVIAGVTIVLGG
jgi:VIT1/CCC1 family predicted Fe2+/Mn2+ transporter